MITIWREKICQEIFLRDIKDIFFRKGVAMEDLFLQAKKAIVGGVNSPVRAFGAVGGTPIFISYARGAKIYDTQGKEYIDYVLSWGPAILGHAYPTVIEAVIETAKKGTTFGAPTVLETKLAEVIEEAIPSIELLRFVSSGTEAVMSAIRLARGYTGRDKIIKFEGCYHGHADSLLVKAGSGVATFGIPGSPGVPRKLAELTITVPYNDLSAVESIVTNEGEKIACIIVEPVAGNMGVVLPEEGFLEGLRRISRERGILLIFDEVITGFRFHYGGYQNLVGIKPDITCLGKIIGGGLPVGAFGGKREIMEMLAPIGPVYQAGTLSGNPLAMAAGIATLNTLREKREDYPLLIEKTAYLCHEMEGIFAAKGIPCQINQAGTMFTAFFTDKRVKNYEDATGCDLSLFRRYFHGMLARGINLAPSPFEAAFLSFAHNGDDIARTLTACEDTLRNM